MPPFYIYLLPLIRVCACEPKHNRLNKISAPSENEGQSEKFLPFDSAGQIPVLFWGWLGNIIYSPDFFSQLGIGKF